jgi:diguanylate cyclase (GGDEF)-like protein
LSSWNRRVAAATRVRDASDPELQAERLAELGLPGGLHPDDATAVASILRLAEGRADGFETTIMGRVFGNERDDEARVVDIVIMGNERGSTALVGSVGQEHDFDSLTGLPGRDYLLDAIDDALQGALRADHRVGVFAIDVDRFKRVNDTSGYSAGDATLRALAAELISVLRPDDIMGRQGGDEFMIVCPHVVGGTEATRFAEQFRSVCADRPVDSSLFGLTLSVGFALGGPDRVAEDLLREAETALHQAKVLGRDRCEMYDDDLRTESERRVTVDQRLREALDRDTIEVHFQPIVEVATGKLVGAEALLRLEGDDGSSLEPCELVRTAEDSGLIRQIEEQVLDQAAATILSIGDAGEEPLHLWVNVSDQRFNDSRFPLALARALHNSDLPAELLRLEISTNVLRGDTVGARLVSQLRALGVRVTIDDFTTPSDSDLISRDAVDVVKLSRDLVQAVHCEQGRARAEVVTADLLSRGVDVCAVGVETPEDLAVIEELGCRFAQGYLFSAPVTGPELAALAGTGF